MSLRITKPYDQPGERVDSTGWPHGKPSPFVFDDDAADPLNLCPDVTFHCPECDEFLRVLTAGGEGDERCGCGKRFRARVVVDAL